MVLVTGSIAFDYIMDFPGKFADNIMPDKIHKINLSFLLSDLRKQNGGTAGNIAYNLALLEIPVSIFATAGNDFEDYLQFLKDTDIDTSNLKIISNKKTACAFIMTDRDDNQITGFYPGAMADSANFSFKDLKSKPKFVIISPNDPTAILKQSLECQKMKIPFMIDMGMQLPRLDKKQIRQIIKDAKILIGNDYEIELLKSKASLTEKDLSKLVKILITTFGAKGSIVKTQKESFRIAAAKPLEVIDPTGAGDAYRAGFIAGFLDNKDLKVCGQMGSVAACYAVEQYGTTTHRFTIEEFKKRYKQNYG